MSEERIWNETVNTPLTNGGIRTVVAPVPPKYTFDGDGQVIEYLVPFPMHMIDARPWKAISYTADGDPISIKRPILVSVPYQPEVKYGNEGAEAFCSIVHLRTPPNVNLPYHNGWKIVERLLEWIRVKCRHYWLLHGITGFGALYRGTVINREGRKLTLQNVASYGPGVVVRPLTEALWLSIGEELARNTEVPLADTIYCDALLSIAARNDMKALLEAGVAAEVAITQLLTQVCSTLPDNSFKAEFRRVQGDFDPFKKKLTAWPQRLGLESVGSFTYPGISESWVQTVQELYQLRNKVAHAGELRPNVSMTKVGLFIFAANALLQYCRSQRAIVGLEDYSMPLGTNSYEQTIVCHDAFLATDSIRLECFIES